VLALAGLALLGGLWAALVRVGWPLPNLPLPVAGQHGALMISGFLGTLISLERAVALQWRPACLPPLLSGLGMLGLILGLPIEAGRALITLGAFGLVAAQTDSSRHYDVMLHSVLLGFVFSMIFGHAPIILPSLFVRPPVYSPMFYGPLAGLHLALAVRLLGDLGGLSGWRLWGGLFNVLTIPLFIGLLLVVMARSRVPVARPR
jgi:hypothetical protein